MSLQKELRKRDLVVNWHPYTQMKGCDTIIPIVRGAGTYLFDADGKHYIDAVSSWWVTLHGHAHPYIAERVYKQLLELEQVIFAGFTHQPAIELSERLLALLPSNQSKIFYTDNGSTAVEVGLKMAIQYHYNKGHKRSKIVAFKNAYHGDTFGAMSVSGRGVWTRPFGELLFDVIFIETPTTDNLVEIKATLSAIQDDIVCFVYEPLVQGAAGMLMHDAEYLTALLQFCRTNQILLIQDEIFVGFGRTGTLFAADQLGVVPDVMCFSKGLTGGTMPLGITSCSSDLYAAFYDDDRSKTLFHGHSFTANPLACAASLASLDLLLEPDTQKNIKRIVQQHTQVRKELQNHPKLKAIRQCGTILALEWKVIQETSYFDTIQEVLYPFFLDKGILIRPLGNIIYLVPPYCITASDLDYIYAIIKEALDLF